MRRPRLVPLLALAGAVTMMLLLGGHRLELRPRTCIDLGCQRRHPVGRPRVVGRRRRLDRVPRRELRLRRSRDRQLRRCRQHLEQSRLPLADSRRERLRGRVRRCRRLLHRRLLHVDRIQARRQHRAHQVRRHARHELERRHQRHRLRDPGLGLHRLRGRRVHDGGRRGARQPCGIRQDNRCRFSELPGCVGPHCGVHLRPGPVPVRRVAAAVGREPVRRRPVHDPRRQHADEHRGDHDDQQLRQRLGSEHRRHRVRSGGQRRRHGLRRRRVHPRDRRRRHLRAHIRGGVQRNLGRGDGLGSRPGRPGLCARGRRLDRLRGWNVRQYRCDTRLPQRSRGADCRERRPRVVEPAPQLGGAGLLHLRPRQRRDGLRRWLIRHRQHEHGARQRRRVRGRDGERNRPLVDRRRQRRRARPLGHDARRRRRVPDGRRRQRLDGGAAAPLEPGRDRPEHRHPDELEPALERRRRGAGGLRLAGVRRRRVHRRQRRCRAPAGRGVRHEPRHRDGVGSERARRCRVRARHRGVDRLRGRDVHERQQDRRHPHHSIPADPSRPRGGVRRGRLGERVRRPEELGSERDVLAPPRPRQSSHSTSSAARSSSAGASTGCGATSFGATSPRFPATRTQSGSSRCRGTRT